MLHTGHAVKGHSDGKGAATQLGFAAHFPLGSVDSAAVQVAAPATGPIQGSIESGSQLILGLAGHDYKL